MFAWEIALCAHHSFGAWHGDKRPQERYGEVISGLRGLRNGTIGKQLPQGPAQPPRVFRYHQPAKSDHIVCFNSLELFRNSLQSGDLQCKPGVSKTTI